MNLDLSYCVLVPDLKQCLQRLTEETRQWNRCGEGFVDEVD